MDRTSSDSFALRELPGDEGDARRVERIPNRPQVLRGDDGVLMSAEEVLHLRRGFDDAARRLARRSAGQFGGVAQSLDLDPERV